MQGLQWICVVFVTKTSLSRAENDKSEGLFLCFCCRSFLARSVCVSTPFCILLSGRHILRNSWLWRIQAKLWCPEADNFYRRLNRQTVLEALTHFCLLLLQGFLSICWYQQLQCNALLSLPGVFSDFAILSVSISISRLRKESSICPFSHISRWHHFCRILGQRQKHLEFVHVTAVTLHRWLTSPR